MSPVAPIAHLLAIAAGLWGGLWIAGEIAPDLPDADTAPGVAAADAAAVEPASPDSLLRPENLGTALTQLDEQLGDEGLLVRLRVAPGELTSTEGDGGFGVFEVSASAPTRLVDLIVAERPEVTLGDIQYLELVQTKAGPEWYVQLVSTRNDLPPPWSYSAPLDLSELTVGGAPPKQIEP